MHVIHMDRLQPEAAAAGRGEAAHGADHLNNNNNNNNNDHNNMNNDVNKDNYDINSNTNSIDNKRYRSHQLHPEDLVAYLEEPRKSSLLMYVLAVRFYLPASLRRMSRVPQRNSEWKKVGIRGASGDAPHSRGSTAEVRTGLTT